MENNGLLLVDKPENITSFALVRALRKRLNVQKIGHTGTLDPFAKGLMVMLVGRKYTKLSNQLLNQDKEYVATLLLGKGTDTFDRDGQTIEESDKVPTLAEILEVIGRFQGELLQTPPMYSAKKVQGKKLYELARAGKTIERAPVPVHVKTELLDYSYPRLTIRVNCSKGTYIRSMADSIGKDLGSFAHLIELERTRLGPYQLNGAIPYSFITESTNRLPLFHADHLLDRSSTST